MGVQAWRYTPYKLSARQIKWERGDYQAAGGKTAFYMDICILKSIARLYSVIHTLLQTGYFFLFWNTSTNVTFHISFQEIHVSIYITLFPFRKEENVNIHFQPTLNLAEIDHFLSTLIQHVWLPSWRWVMQLNSFYYYLNHIGNQDNKNAINFLW